MTDVKTLVARSGPMLIRPWLKGRLPRGLLRLVARGNVTPACLLLVIAPLDPPIGLTPLHVDQSIRRMSPRLQSRLCGCIRPYAAIIVMGLAML